MSIETSWMCLRSSFDTFPRNPHPMKSVRKDVTHCIEGFFSKTDLIGTHLRFNGWNYSFLLSNTSTCSMKSINQSHHFSDSSWNRLFTSFPFAIHSNHICWISSEVLFFSPGWMSPFRFLETNQNQSCRKYKNNVYKHSVERKQLQPWLSANKVEHLSDLNLFLHVCIAGHGSIRVNGRPLHLVEPQALRFKLEEPIYLLGREKFANVDVRLRVKGGGRVAQIYAIRQALAKSLVAYTQKFVDEATKKQIRDILVQYDRTLLVADPRRCEPKKFGGPGARAKYQKSYR